MTERILCRSILAGLLVLIFLPACANFPISGPVETVSAPAEPPTTPPPDIEEVPPQTLPELPDQALLVAFVHEGNIQLWNSLTGETETVFNSGDVVGLTMSEDGAVIAFLRRATLELATNEFVEQSALWAMDVNGENPRELLSAEWLRQQLNIEERYSSNIPRMVWLPGTHRLLFSGWSYIVMAEGESHAIPDGLFLVDVDTSAATTLLPAGHQLVFEPSPDGKQIALITETSLSFIASDGTNMRKDVMTYDQVGMAGPHFPIGVWTRDSEAFVFTGSLVRDERMNIDFTIWRVPVDGSNPTKLHEILGSDPRSMTFSPDGVHAAVLIVSKEDPPTVAGWQVFTLGEGAGPLANSYEIEIGYRGVHWSPGGEAFTGMLEKLCPDASDDSDMCETWLHPGTIAAIRWIDETRVLFLTRDPSALYLANLDGKTVTVASWRTYGPDGFRGISVAKGEK